MFKLTQINDLFDPGIFHFKFIDTDFDYMGVGSDRSKEAAINKAISEYFEYHIAKDKNLKFTVGISVHPDKNQSVIKSQLEVLERHYFLYSWFNNHNPFWIKKILLREKYIVNLGIVAQNEKICVAAAILTSDKKNIAFRLLLAAESTFLECEEKLILDCHRMMTLIERSDLSDLKIPLDFSTPIHHAINYLNPTPENFLFIEKYLTKSDSPIIISDNFDFETSTSEHIFYGKRYASFTKCNNLISYFTGEAEKIIQVNYTIPQSRKLHPVG